MLLLSFLIFYATQVHITFFMDPPSIEIYQSILMNGFDCFLVGLQLLQLLMKASQDKKFVCEEADRVLKTMVESMTPLPLLHKLRAYVSHTNPRIRAKAAISVSHCLSKMVQILLP